MPAASQPGARPLTTRPRLLVERLDFLADPERAFAHIYGASPQAFWLDGSAGGERGRFSFMGDASGPLAAVVTYDLCKRRVRIERGAGVEVRDESIFDYLDRELAALAGLDADLPFGFQCGLVGYLGYELKAECDGDAAHSAVTPDASFIRADRLIAFDHHERRTYLLALTPTPRPSGAWEWIEPTARRLEALPELVGPEPAPVAGLRLRRSPERYREDVEACRRYLRAGHSYEICLTNAASTAAPPSSLELYRSLRRANPAPFSAYLRFGDLAVLSSSPERFLSVDREGRAESRPIKGTSARGRTAGEDARLAESLAADPKNRAENVTIVDLVRNDLGRVCEVGSVEVAELMRVESYETVHQLVSAIRGRLRAGVATGEAIRACFPPGSMTGAPKRRTMEIIDELEEEARGVYSGAIGWLGPGGACDLSVAIRTIVLDRDSLSIGAGGAIVVDSDPERELAEMLLKAAAPAAALGPGASISFDPAVAPGDSRRRPLSPTPTS
jgi:para-aminobenzoate synthetase